MLQFNSLLLDFIGNLVDYWPFSVIIAGFSVYGLFTFNGVIWKLICSLFLALFFIFYIVPIAILLSFGFRFT